MYIVQRLYFDRGHACYYIILITDPHRETWVFSAIEEEEVILQLLIKLLSAIEYRLWEV